MNFAKIGGLLELLELLEHKTMKCVANYLHNANSCRFVLRLRCGAVEQPVHCLSPHLIITFHYTKYVDNLYLWRSDVLQSQWMQCWLGDLTNEDQPLLCCDFIVIKQARTIGITYLVTLLNNRNSQQVECGESQNNTKSMTYFYFPSELPVTGSQRKVRVHWLHLNLHWWHYWLIFDELNILFYNILFQIQFCWGFKYKCWYYFSKKSKQTKGTIIKF